MILLDLLIRRKGEGWFSRLTGISVEIPGEWYWWAVGIAFGITAVGWLVKTARRR